MINKHRIIIASVILCIVTLCNSVVCGASVNAQKSTSYTKSDIEMLAKLIYGEAGCDKCNTKAEQAAVVWTVLNRVDDDRWANTIKGVVKQRKQFTGYKSSHPVMKAYVELATDVLERWTSEKNGNDDVGRTLPSNYFFFKADKSNHHKNVFRKEYKSRDVWDWSAIDPYTEE